LTGFLICKTTSWGFTRYRWVIAKWIGTLSGILVGSALLGPWQMQMVELSSQPESNFVTGASYGLMRTLFTLVGSLQVILLVLIVAVSVMKPWSKRLSRQTEASTLLNKIPPSKNLSPAGQTVLHGSNLVKPPGDPVIPFPDERTFS
jgi:hypothetical protein